MTTELDFLLKEDEILTEGLKTVEELYKLTLDELNTTPEEQDVTITNLINKCNDLKNLISDLKIKIKEKII